MQETWGRRSSLVGRDNLFDWRVRASRRFPRHPRFTFLSVKVGEWRTTNIHRDKIRFVYRLTTRRWLCARCGTMRLRIRHKCAFTHDEFGLARTVYQLYSGRTAPSPRLFQMKILRTIFWKLSYHIFLLYLKIKRKIIFYIFADKCDSEVLFRKKMFSCIFTKHHVITKKILNTNIRIRQMKMICMEAIQMIVKLDRVENIANSLLLLFISNISK